MLGLAEDHTLSISIRRRAAPVIRYPVRADAVRSHCLSGRIKPSCCCYLQGQLLSVTGVMISSCTADSGGVCAAKLIARATFAGSCNFSISGMGMP
jgi:hypothetical protein